MTLTGFLIFRYLFLAVAQFHSLQVLPLRALSEGLLSERDVFLRCAVNVCRTAEAADGANGNTRKGVREK